MFLNNNNFTELSGQSKESEFTLSLFPFGLNTYFPVNASITPYPPDVPGKNASINAFDLSNISSTNNVLPENITVTNGISLSCSLILLITWRSKSLKLRLRLGLCGPFK